MSASAEAVCVDPKQVHLVWPEVSHWIDRAMERGGLGLFNDVEDDVLNGRALLWLVWQEPIIGAACVTQVTETDSGKVCTIVAYGGEGGLRCLDLISRIEDYAREQSCGAVRIMGRIGWKRMLPNYRATKVILERRI